MEMQSSERAKANPQEAIEKRREKKWKREKELRKAAKAAGMKLNTVSPVEARHDQYHQEPAITTTTPGTEPAPAPSKKLEFAVGVWSTVKSSSSSGDFKKPR